MECFRLSYLEIYLLFRITSIVTVFVNKALLSSDAVNLDAPLFVTWFQCVVSAAICFVMSKLSQLCPGCVSFPKGNPMEMETFKNVRRNAVNYMYNFAFND